MEKLKTNFIEKVLLTGALISVAGLFVTEKIYDDNNDNELSIKSEEYRYRNLFGLGVFGFSSAVVGYRLGREYQDRHNNITNHIQQIKKLNVESRGRD